MRGTRALLPLLLLAASLAFVHSIQGRPVGPRAALPPTILPEFQCLDAPGLERSPANTVAVDTFWFGGTTWDAVDQRWEALPDSQWTFDTGVGSGFEAVAACGGASRQTLLEGWRPADLNQVPDQKIRRMATGNFPGAPCVGSPGGLGGDYSIFVGLLPPEADSACWVNPGGYGNNWDVSITRPCTQYVSLSFDYRLDVEPGFDYAYVIVDTECSDEPFDDQVLWSMTGSVSGNAVVSGTVPEGSCYRVRIGLDSDGEYSDEDGGYSSGGCSFVVDNVAFSGLATFETGMDGWEIHEICPRDRGRLESLADLPPIDPGLGGCNLEDSVLVFFDPATGEIPADALGVVTSPWVDLGQAGRVGVDRLTIAFDRYSNLPLKNYQFVILGAQWSPSSATGSCQGISPFTSLSYYFGDTDTTCSPTKASVVIPGDAEAVRVLVGMVDYCGFFPDCLGGTSHAWIDNVRLGFSEHVVVVRSDGSGDWPTIQAAIDAADPGTTIYLEDGRFRGAGNRDIDFLGKAITLRSLNGNPQACVIDCEGLGRGFVLQNAEGLDTRIEGIRVVSGYSSGDGGGMSCSGASPTLVDCVFDSCSSDLNGAGVACNHGSSPSFTDCVFSENHALRHGGGMRAWDASNPVLQGCAFVANSALRGGGISTLSSCELQVTDTEFRGNSAVERGGAISLAIGCPGTITSCTFSGNLCDEVGAAVNCRLDSDVTISGCTFVGNAAPSGGSSLRLDAASGIVDRCIMAFSPLGAPVLCENGASLSVTCSDLYGNTDGNWVGCVAGMDLINHNLEADPGFCDLANGYFGLQSDSPCAEANNPVCGRIGAFGVGCSSSPLVDGQLDGVYGLPVASDSDQDGNGNAVMDLLDLYLAEDAQSLYVFFTIDGNIATDDWGKYVLYLDATNDGSGATYDAWLRNVSVADPHRPEFSVNTWVDSGPYGPDHVQFFSWNGASWDGPTQIAEAALSGGSTSAIEWRIPKTLLTTSSGTPGVLKAAEGSALWCEVWSTGSGPDNAQDTVNDPAEDWNATDWTTTATLLCSSPTQVALAVGEDAQPRVPGLAAWPNPASGRVALRYSAMPGERVDICIFDVSGRLVTRYRPETEAGVLHWEGLDREGRRVAPGIYFVRMAAADRVETTRIVRLP